MEANNGNLSDAFEILGKYQNDFPRDSVLWKKIFEYRYSIKAEIDLNCLNVVKQNCQKVDLEGNPYLLSSQNLFVAQKDWIPFKIKGRHK